VFRAVSPEVAVGAARVLAGVQAAAVGAAG
jgi:hypothetical protein